MHNSCNRSIISRKSSHLLTVGLLTALIGWGTAGVSRADIVQYSVSFSDLNAFQFDAGSGPYALDFFLSGGSNTTSVSGSNFGGYGTDASTDFSLDNSAGEAEAVRGFTPPTTSPAPTPFTFNLTANYTPGSLDTFSFGFYKNYTPGNQSLITTTEPAPLQQSFFTIDFSSNGNPIVSTYSSDDPGFNIGAPTVTLVNAVATPEPETWAMMLLGVCALAIMGARRKRSQQSHEVTLAV